jgi:geranylgeranyl transferase type-2 subunit beta
MNITLYRFGGSKDHDPHILYTLSALQILALCDQLHRVDGTAVAKFISKLQQPDGSFFGDQWGEVDTRFSYCALSAMSLLGRLNSGEIDVEKAVEFVARYDR